MIVLPDTSIWVDYLRQGKRGAASHLDDLLAAGAVMTCGPVAAELLAGASATDRASIWTFLRALPWASIGQAEWEVVGRTAALLRQRGAVLPMTDIQIAVAGHSVGALVWTRDAGFERLPQVLPGLSLYQPS